MKAKLRNQVKHSYSSDRPIFSKKQDVLGRSKFAEQLAGDLGTWGGEDSLVVGLYGAWGSGKTSLKNMLLEANRRKDSAQLPVIEFNPWQLSGTGGIPLSFFRELSVALRQEGPEKDVEKRGKKLDSYAKTLALAGSTFDWTGKVLPWIGIPGGPAAETLGKSLTAVSGIAKEGGEALKAKNEAAKSLEEQKRELGRLLSHLPQPLLVVIDDIDRLTTKEILQIFQLVKANADFPRLIYLLLFEREIVTTALNCVSGNKGVEFLEKIVQVGYHIPHASRPAVQKVLFNGLDVHLKEEIFSKRWDKHRWTDLYSDGIAPFFTNLRRVYRFLASFTFHVRHHRTKHSFEVNPVDLIGLEALRVFEPGVYECLPKAKSILTRCNDRKTFGFRGTKQDVIDQAIEQIILRSSSENQSVVKSLLRILFPPITTGWACLEKTDSKNESFS